MNRYAGKDDGVRAWDMDWETLPILTTSERGTARRCWQRWWWAYREGLRPMGPPPTQLWFGTGIHLALAEWYVKPKSKKKNAGFKRGVDPRETWDKYCDDEIAFMKTKFAGADFEEDQWVDAKELGLSMLENYLEEYGRDEHVEMIEPERHAEVLIPHPRNPEQPILRYNGTFDGVYRDHEDDGKVKLWEHKTAGSISLRHLSLDDQAGSYWAIATTELRRDGTLGPREKIAGITYNFLRKAAPDDRPMNEDGYYLNKDGSVSKRQPPPHFVREFVVRRSRERATQIRRIADEARHMELIRDGELPVTKNTTKDCAFDCPFFQMCELHEADSDWEEYRDAMFRVQDPYAYGNYRKSA